MTNWIDDNLDLLHFPKVDGTDKSNPLMNVPATDMNAIRAALRDIQAWLRGTFKVFKASDATKIAHIDAVTASPNGSVTGTKGSIAIDVANAKIWQNTDGSTAWSDVTAGGGGGATVASVLNATTIATWGDSLTSGTGAVSPPGGYPSQLSALSGYPITNGGVAGETSTQIKTRMLAATSEYGYPTIIWAGRNNFASPTTVQSDIASMVAALGHQNYLILSVVNTDTASEYSGGSDYTTIIALNATLGATYGAHFWDVRSYLVSQYDPGIPQDVTDHGHDIPPSSLRSDTTHYNDAGYALIAAQILARMSLLQMGLHGLNEADFRFILGGSLFGSVLSWKGSTTLTPRVVLGGATPQGDEQIALKNARTSGASGGVVTAIDTSVNASARAGYTFFRGANGGYSSGNSAGVWVSSGGDVIIGAAAGDLCLYTELTNKLLFSADSSGFTLGMQLDNGGNLGLKGALRIGGVTTGPIFTTNAGSPEGVVTAGLGSYCADTTNGEGYIKKTGAGNTGWKLITHA